MRLNPALLKSKGWEPEEIQHASSVSEAAERKKHLSLILLDHSVYWILLVLVLLGNIAAALFLLPVVAFLPGAIVYLVVGMVGVCLGTLFTIIMRDIEKAQRGHHLFAGIILPAVSIIAFASMAQVANAQGIKAAAHSTVGISLVYGGLFLLPYLFFLTEERFELFDTKKEA